MFIQTVAEEQATGDLADYYKQQRAAWGFLPDYAGAFSTRPDVAQVWNLLNTTIRDSMDRRRFELATITAARALRSTYCTVAHASFLRDVCRDEETVRALAADPSGGGLGDQDRAVYEFAARVATDAAAVEQADIDRLHEVGLSDAEVAEVVYAVAARAFFTRVLDGLGARLDRATADSLPHEVLAPFLVGRPVGET